MRKNKKKIMAAATVAPLIVGVIPTSLLDTPTAEAATFSGGSGTVQDPYLISTPQELNAVRNFPNAYFKLIQDIDLSGINWVPIDNFTGTLDGNGKEIRNLTIRSTSNNVGLFGSIDRGATIKNLGLVNVDIETTGSYVGGIVGYANSYYGYSNIQNCYVLGGTIKGSSNVGGIAGYGMANVQKVFSTANVVGSGSNIGGLAGAGYLNWTDVFATGNVTGDSAVGGLFGSLYGNLTNAYALGSVTARQNAGGITSYFGLTPASYTNTMKNVFALNPSVVGSESSIGKVMASKYDSNPVQNVLVHENQAGNGMHIRNGATGVIKNQDISNQSTYTGFDFSNTWTLDESGLPILKFKDINLTKPQYGTEITSKVKDNVVYAAINTPEELAAVKGGGLYILARDLDLSGRNWVPIPTFNAYGVFDGDGHVIRNLSIKSNSNNVGLFGYVYEWATIKNLGLENVDIETTGNNVGALVGMAGYKIYAGNAATIENVYVVNGTVRGGSTVGGLIGQGHATVSKCFSDVDVYGTNNVGGLIGTQSVDLKDSYAIGDVFGSSNVGGVNGYQQGNVDNVYAAGNVQATGDYVGGISGYVALTIVNYTVHLNKSFYLNPTVKGTGSNVGKLVGGKDGGSHQFNNNQALSTMNGTGNTQYVANQITPDQALKQSTYLFNNWNFGVSGEAQPIWGIDENKTLPYLKSMPQKYYLNASNGTWVNASEALGSPENLNAEVINANDVKLTWDPVQGATEYIIEGDGVELGRSSSTEYVVYDVQTGIHEYKVRPISSEFGGTNSSVTVGVGLNTANIPIVANITTLQDTFEDPVRTFNFQGDWAPTTEAAKNGTKSFGRTNKGKNSTTSKSTITVNGPATLSFGYMVSSEANYDLFRVKIDGTEVIKASGNVPWTDFTKELTNGTHTIEFSYSKDSSAASGLDGAFIDDLKITSANGAPVQTQLPSGKFYGVFPIGDLTGVKMRLSLDGGNTFGTWMDGLDVFDQLQKGQIYTNLVLESTSPVEGAFQYFYEPVAANHVPTINQDIKGKTIDLSNPSLQIDLSSVFQDQDGDALTYIVQSDQPSIVNAEIDGSTISLTGLKEGGATITVTADDGKGGKVETSFFVSVVAEAPTVEFTQNTFEFAAVPNATEYIILRNGQEVDRIPESGQAKYVYTDTDLTPGTTYTYEVQPVYVTGEGIPIEIGTFETLSMDIATMVNGNDVTVSWTPISEAEGYRIVFKNSNGQVVSSQEVANNVTSVTKTIASAGNYVVEITPKLNGVYGEGQTDTFTIAKDLNHNPTASTIPNQTLKVTDAPKTIDVKSYFSDADGDPLSFTVSSNNGNVTVSNNGSQVIITPKALGTSTITVTANDGKGGTVQQTFTVTVQEVAPAAVQNLQVVANSYNKVTVTFDPAPRADEYIIKRNGQEVARITGTSYVDNNVAAETTYNYEVIAVNEAGQSAPASMSVITPKKPNTNPTASAIPNQTLKVTDSPKTIDVKGYFSDADGDTLTFSVQVNNGNVTVTNNGSQVTITPKSVGTSTITVTANDGKGGTVQQTFTVTVQEVAPAAVQNLQVVANSYNKVTVTFDPAPRADEYIIKRNGQEVARITGTSYVDNNVAAETTYNYEVIAVNEAGQSTPVSMNVVTPKKPNTAPTAKAIPNQTLKVTDSPKTIDVKNYFSDADGDTLTFSVQANNGNVDVSNNGSQVTITPKSVGTSTITITADDGKGGTVQQTFTVTVQEVAPDTVQNIQVSLDGTKAVVTWDAFPNATGYRVQRYVKNSDGQFVKDGFARSVTSTAYEDTTLVEGKEYQYEITPRTNVYLTGSAGMSAPVVVPSTTPEEPPTSGGDNGTTVPSVQVQVNGSTVTVTWPSIDGGVTRYRVERFKKDANGQYVRDGVAKSVSETTVTETLPSGEYKFVITPRVGYVYDTTKAMEGFGTVGGTSTGGGENTTSPATTYVPNVHAIVNGTKVTLQWDPYMLGQQAAEYYRVIRYVKDEQGQFVQDGPTRTVNDTHFEDTLAANKEYRYEVIPRGTATYLFDKATKVSLTALAEGEREVFASDYVLSDGRTQYEVQRYVKDAATGQYVADGQPFTVNQLSFVDPNPIDANKEYKYTFK